MFRVWGFLVSGNTVLPFQAYEDPDSVSQTVKEDPDSSSSEGAPLSTDTARPGAISRRSGIYQLPQHPHLPQHPVVQRQNMGVKDLAGYEL
ncbi:hypothetical protein AVEN_16662-1 [Araneus ventricosus]|uniref:Uncharacterized protein n=1 Tax=Araneus ventricosus TaxID=182803 RepID=A0A4Y2UZB7_ARAVE|nr:hypothetical protein AVEN_16662-1 [Araneus ventricosus]